MTNYIYDEIDRI